MNDQPPTLSYLERLPLWPQFDLTADDVNGRVPSCRVESWQSFQANLNGEKDDPTGADKVYRGQRRHDWPLESTLTRQFGGGSIPDDMAEQMLKKFKLAMRGRGIDLSALEDAREVWAYGQHFGLATPLVDWTDSPFVALFFAFSRADLITEKENPSRAVFCLNRAEVDKLLPELFFEPALGENARLVNQAGLFTVTPPGDDNLASAIINAVIDSGAIDPENASELARYVCKVHIPNVDRAACLSMLRKMNIHHANLFPDPTGASQYCNDWLSRCVLEQKSQKDQERKAREVAKRRPSLTLQEIANLDIDNAGAVEAILKDCLSDDENHDLGMMALKIDAKYNETASLDWPNHSSGVSRLRVAFKRLLALLDYPEDAVSVVIEQLIGFYKAKYEAKS